MNRYIDRRMVLAMGSGIALGAGGAVDETLRTGIARRKIPAVVGMVAGGRKTLYAGAFGVRDAAGVPVRTDSIFQVMSMTKAITTVAVLQLVEQRKVELDAPVSKYLKQFEGVQVLDRFDAGGKAVLRAAKVQPTVRQLLTHTSGLCYDTWDGDMFRYTTEQPEVLSVPGPLMFEPGTRWQYGRGLDWAGRLVEAVSGLTLEEYFQKRILGPLGMVDTSYVLPAAKMERWVSNYRRSESGVLVQEERKLPSAPTSFNGGGGLYSTGADYVRFMQMVLNGGVGGGGERILQTASVGSMTVNQIGALTVGKMQSFRPARSSAVDLQPGQEQKWSLGFLLNPTAHAGGRAAGSLAWAGLYNTFFWIDLKSKICAVLLMQFLPFVDREAVGLLGDFERSVYKQERR